MKKIVMILMLILCFLIGCEEQLAKPDLQELLMKPPVEWVNKYGDGFESQQIANLVLAVQVINNQGEAIKQLNSRLIVLETNAVTDKDEKVDPNKNKPYIYDDPLQKDPNVFEVFGSYLDIVCTKHGRLGWGDKYVFLGDENAYYCGKCAFDVARMYLDKHIGVDPNE